MRKKALFVLLCFILVVLLCFMLVSSPPKALYPNETYLNFDENSRTYDGVFVGDSVTFSLQTRYADGRDNTHIQSKDAYSEHELILPNGIIGAVMDTASESLVLLFWQGKPNWQVYIQIVDKECRVLRTDHVFDRAELPMDHLPRVVSYNTRILLTVCAKEAENYAPQLFEYNLKTGSVKKLATLPFDPENVWWWEEFGAIASETDKLILSLNVQRWSENYHRCIGEQTLYLFNSNLQLLSVTKKLTIYFRWVKARTAQPRPCLFSIPKAEKKRAKNAYQYGFVTTGG